VVGLSRDDDVPEYMILARFTKVPREEYRLENIEPVTKMVGQDDAMLMWQLRPDDFDTVMDAILALDRTAVEKDVFDLDEGELWATDHGTWKIRCPKCGDASYFDNWREDGCDWCGFNPARIRLAFEGENSVTCPECGAYKHLKHEEECSESGYFDAGDSVMPEDMKQ
jgi:ribosomal protein L37E